MYLIEVEFHSWADMSNIKAEYINGFEAIFRASSENIDMFIEESENREDVKRYLVYEVV